MSSPRVIDLLARSSRPLLSFEFFPPKTDKGMENLRQTAGQLLIADPDFATVTWGAGGSTRARTLEICTFLREMGYRTVMPHLTCVGASRGELREIIQEIYALGFRNIMALRGDPPLGKTTFQPHPDGLQYAYQLIELIKETHPDFCCGVAGYPETHPQSSTLEQDIVHLKTKLDAGGDFITTQLFYDNERFYHYMRCCRDAGIEHTILPGLLPVMSLPQAERLTAMCGASFPDALHGSLAKVGGEGEEAAQAGLKWTAQQMRDLLKRRSPGIHLYVLNKARAALAPALAYCFR